MYGVILVAIVHIVVEVLVECLCLHLTVIVGDGDDFMLGKLYSTCFMHVDMTATHTDNTLVLVQHRVDGSGVSLSTAGEEEYLSIGQTAGHADALFCTFTKLVETVWGWFGVVVFNQVLQNLWMSPVVVVAFK